MHAVCKFMRVDSSCEIGLCGAGGRVLLVELLNEVELGSLLRVGVFAVSDEVVDRLVTSRVESEGLIGFGQESGGPDLVITAWPCVVQHDVRREVLILRSKSVGHPRPERGEARAVGATHQFDRSGGVIVLLQVHRVEKAHLVDVL